MTPDQNRTSLSTEQECMDFIDGCLFMGTGGGGSPDEGLPALQHGLSEGLEMGWVAPESISDDALAVTVYASGSIAPQDAETERLLDSLQLGEPARVDTAMVGAVEQLAAFLGREVGCVVPVELGASNSPGPLVTAARLGVPVPDGDYSGRAVPDEMQGTPFIYNVDSHPFASVDFFGNTAVVPTVANPYMLERLSKMLSIAGVHGTAVASTPLDGRDMKRILVPGTLTKCLSIGRSARQARESGEDPVEAAVETAGGWRLFDGIIVDKEWEDRDGYMFGHVVIEGSPRTPAAGKTQTNSTLRLWFKNENHVSWLNGQPWVCSPDLMTVVEADTGRGVTSTDLAVGAAVSVVGMRGLDVFRTPDALQRAFGPAYFGFDDVPYHPIEELV